MIGVTGHRDLHASHEPRLRAEVTDAIRRLKRDYLRGDSNTPIIILSALAEGADSLVADVALDEGAILIAPFPMEEAEYREDFRGSHALRPDAMERFDALRKCALGTIEMPYRDGSSRELVRDMPERRDDQYLDLGLYIVLHCHLLIALSNGEDGARGGTAQVVDFKRSGIPYELSKDARSALDGSEIGPVIEITTPRMKAGSPQVEIRAKAWGFDLTDAPARGVRRFMRDAANFARIFLGRHPANHQSDPTVRAWDVFRATTNQTRRFNSQAASVTAAALKTSLRGLFTDYADGAAPERRAERTPIHLPQTELREELLVDARDFAHHVAARWCEVYQRADALALRWQRSFKDDWFTLFFAAFMAIAFFEAFAHVLHSNLLLGMYIVSLGVGFFLFIRARVNFHQESFLDFRALAEAVRVAIYWKSALIAGHVSDVYPIKQPSELAWVKIVVRTFDMLDDALGPPLPQPDRRALEDVRRLWLVGQWSYFTGQSESLSLLAEKREAWSLAALALSPLIGAIGIVASFLVHDEHVWHPWREAMIVLMGLLVGAGATIAGHAEQLAFKARGRQYERMSFLFEKALLLVNRILNSNPQTIPADDAKRVQDLYVELGAEAMKEHSEWVAIYRQRPIRPAG